MARTICVDCGAVIEVWSVTSPSICCHLLKAGLDSLASKIALCWVSVFERGMIVIDA
jgi:hypothetical protein